MYALKEAPLLHSSLDHTGACAEAKIVTQDRANFLQRQFQIPIVGVNGGLIWSQSSGVGGKEYGGILRQLMSIVPELLWVHPNVQ